MEIGQRHMFVEPYASAGPPPSAILDATPQSLPAQFLKPLAPASRPGRREAEPKGLLPSLGLAVLWALAAVSGSAFVLLMDQMPISLGSRFASARIDGGSAEPIGRGTAVALARTVLLRLDDANRTGNYAIFRDTSSAAFQSMNGVDDLARIFAWLREQRVSLAPAALLEPGLLSPTVMEKGGIVHIRGSVPDKIGGLNFDLLFQDPAQPGMAADWRLFGIALYRG